ncbi:MAG: triose-phosphate isomerase, partial [Candidatus Diapherotrites archaeon]|nr:triose-phosphate isomerase [Candidatus Diapherotrites archaeon]
MEPVLFINFKTYAQGTGLRAVELARVLEQVSAESGRRIVPVIQPVDVRLVARQCSLP